MIDTQETGKLTSLEGSEVPSAEDVIVLTCQEKPANQAEVRFCPTDGGEGGGLSGSGGLLSCMRRARGKGGSNLSRDFLRVFLGFGGEWCRGDTAEW